MFLKSSFLLSHSSQKNVLERLSKQCWKNAKVMISPFLFWFFKSTQARPLLQSIYKGLKNMVTIYPISMPSITVNTSLDFLLLELPPRYLPMMPNGIGYVHNILKKTGSYFQTIDLNVIVYHQFHSERILGKKTIMTKGGYEMKEDPWENINSAEWEHPEVIEYFLEKLDDLI